VGQWGIAGGKEEDGSTGVARAWRRGDPSSGQLRDCRFVGTEAEARSGGTVRSCRSGSLRVEHKLPLSLIKEEAEREIAAYGSGDDGEADGFEKPDMADHYGLRGPLGGYAGWLCGGAGHGLLLELYTGELPGACGNCRPMSWQLT
jgi:hypothetical protein